MTHDEKLGIVYMHLGMFLLVLCGVLLLGFGLY